MSKPVLAKVLNKGIATSNGAIRPMTRVATGLDTDIMVFDFYSKASMHLPFNEGYLRILRAAFPDSNIIFHADAAHLQKLEPQLPGLNVSLAAVPRSHVPHGLSFHNPIGATLAARGCFAVMSAAVRTPVRLVAVLGVDAALYRVITRKWQRRLGPVDLLLHGSLAANYVWRSRNPFIRWWDLRSTLRRPVREGVRLLGLELGVDSALCAEFPRLSGAVGVLEHPVLQRDWSDSTVSWRTTIAVGFLGFGSVRKGFDIFAGLATSARNPAVAFDAVGHCDHTADLDISGLRLKLSPTSLPREVYLEQLRHLDLVCLPLHGRSYEFAASGTVSDAIAALKPILAFRNRTLQAIWDRYGPIGELFDSAAGMLEYLSGLDRATFEASRRIWTDNLRAVRAARQPEILGLTYRGKREQRS
jgi:hypothetical protein